MTATATTTAGPGGGSRDDSYGNSNDHSNGNDHRGIQEEVRNDNQDHGNGYGPLAGR